MRRFHDDILPILTIDLISSARHSHGLAALLAASRRNFSLVDCVSFDAMRQRDLRHVFGFGKHVEEQGFTTNSEPQVTKQSQFLERIGYVFTGSFLAAMKSVRLADDREYPA